ncbi:MAG: RNA polymerase sigma-54 factor [Phycisphaerales bacterium]|jgi:RNA polymerase sigma-54 factor
MRFDTSQSMKMGQHMKLAPRMIQSMEILQMPLAELEERIEQELESNPTLELQEIEAEARADGQLDTDPRSPDAPDVASGDLDAGNSEDDFARLDAFENADPDGAANQYDDDGAHHNAERGLDRGGDQSGDRGPEHEGHYSASRMAGERDGKMDAMAQAPAGLGSLTDQLLNQWGVVDVEARLHEPGQQIIGFLDDDGYLRTPMSEVMDRAPQPLKDTGLTEADWELSLQAVQLLLEPAGVGARDAAECLLLQLDAIEDQADREGDSPRIGNAEAIESARLLITKHFVDLMKNRLPKIAAGSGLSLDDINAGIEVMRRLSLAPARRLVEQSEAAIRPDAVVEFDEEGDRYIAYLVDHRMSQLCINREYALMAKDRKVQKTDREFLRKNLSNAQWLMDAVEQRRGTLLRVILAVLDEQRDFFDYGPEALKPLPMKTISDRLGVHVATVSRAVSEKWLQTPRGIVPLRGFFTQGMATESGEEVSSSALKATLQEIVDNEDKAKPLSDEALCKAMNDKGFEIARRTIAKYRGQLDIPSARMRKQF